MSKVTIEEVKENMQDVLCRTEIEFDKPVTYVTVRMKNGFTIRESTTCVDTSNYDEEIGKQICLEKIESRIWHLLGYALQEKVYQIEEQERRMKEWRDAFEQNNRFFIKGKVIAENIKSTDSTVIFDADKIIIKPYNKTLKEVLDDK